ncbi:rho GTPase-activating protein gacW-like isoform X2 [Denticeps clupeoides]|uniref:rho GTPase-activating protein gacW-like isoform X2 n=1 Tax=Denticeps clupeoides TaxID=299321 RepID=UPI0010A52AB7|nr:rho GTPase-activating protein gacW-like isoform X2 [Denticeps clupeoides]
MVGWKRRENKKEESNTLCGKKELIKKLNISGSSRHLEEHRSGLFPRRSGVTVTEVLKRAIFCWEPFLLDACTSLFEHVQTEGIFRKFGSVARIKALRAKLDQGEDCLSLALPLDVAGLLKQFSRELPEPILPECREPDGQQ